MTAGDAPAVARLFLKIFRSSDKPASADLVEYLRKFALESPSYEVQAGTQVYEQRDGSIRSALLTVPMRFVACGNVVPGRLLCVFMTDANKEALGAAQLILALRPRNADFSFCSSASPMSRSHLLAIGGKPISVMNLEWSRCFRPAGALVRRVADRFFHGRDFGAAYLVRPIDSICRRMIDKKSVGESIEADVVEMPVEEFLEQAPKLIAHFAVRPLWPKDELAWLISMAAQNTRFGSLTIRAVNDRSGANIGSFVYYAAPGREAHVLNVLALPGKELTVLNAMFLHLDRTGHVEAHGRAQPFLMAGLALQKWLVFRHKAFALAVTRLPDVNDAVARGDIYVGGLAGEDWSRLMSDFD